MTFDIQLQKAIKTAKQAGHRYIVVLPINQELTDTLVLEPLARYDLSRHMSVKISGNGYEAIFGKISDFSKSYLEHFFRKCSELKCEIKFETF